MSILVFSSLFPNAQNPLHGLFVSELCVALSRRTKIRVIAPVNGLQSLLAGRGLKVKGGTAENQYAYPVFWNIPRFFKALDARLMSHFSRKAFQEAISVGAKLVHAHYAYPDGAAAAILARETGLPYLVTVHGSDINVLAQDQNRRALIAETLREASAVVAVSKELAAKVQALGVPGDRVHCIPNGVDLDKFSPGCKNVARKKLGLPLNKRVLLTVGRLDPVKGYDRLIETMCKLPRDVFLVMAGEGGERGRLQGQIDERELSDRIVLAGAVAHDKLTDYYQAADSLVISSHSEGWPTIIFEAAACGTPISATAVGGIPEIISNFHLGTLIPDNRPESLVRGIEKTLAMKWDVDGLNGIAAEHSWSRIADQYLRLYKNSLRERGGGNDKGKS